MSDVIGKHWILTVTHRFHSIVKDCAVSLKFTNCLGFINKWVVTTLPVQVFCYVLVYGFIILALNPHKYSISEISV